MQMGHALFENIPGKPGPARSPGARIGNPGFRKEPAIERNRHFELLRPRLPALPIGPEPYPMIILL